MRKPDAVGFCHVGTKSKCARQGTFGYLVIGLALILISFTSGGIDWLRITLLVVASLMIAVFAILVYRSSTRRAGKDWLEPSAHVPFDRMGSNLDLAWVSVSSSGLLLRLGFGRKSCCGQGCGPTVVSVGGFRG
ncbi:hypothetical protein, partial [Amycolatopsis sp. cmx-11-12]|uniref:hypothetical protein n=1 Tax=Amycolatopsis sp. cmx-11-12 TaxID=2785795 RepID=UPI003917DC16